jgi:L-2-hydroxyglutarate oxidase
VLAEKEPELAAHQTGHNSGVLHSGIYYQPGSLRAINCRAGKKAMEEFCSQYAVPYEICGKVIVATDESQLPALNRIFERGQQNGVRCELIGRERLGELEPHTAGIQAIHVPESGIVDYRAVSLKLAEILSSRPCEIWTNAAVTAIDSRQDAVYVTTRRGEIAARYLINCAGLYSDRIARKGGQKLETQIVPFRGEYYELKPEATYLCRNLIYPVPDPSFPFLGVHFTRMIGGGVECGPNAVFAMAREGYHKWSFNARDLAESLMFVGFRRLAWKYWRTGLGEIWRSLSKAAFVRALQRLVPEIRSEQLVPARAGVRAQALKPEGQLVDDFLILDHHRIVNVANAPSPAATSSLNVGKLIIDRLTTIVDA